MSQCRENVTKPRVSWDFCSFEMNRRLMPCADVNKIQLDNMNWNDGKSITHKRFSLFYRGRREVQIQMVHQIRISDLRDQRSRTRDKDDKEVKRASMAAVLLEPTQAVIVMQRMKRSTTGYSSYLHWSEGYTDSVAIYMQMMISKLLQRLHHRMDWWMCRSFIPQPFWFVNR